MSRRRFLELMGASLALAGLTGCTRQPEEEIVPYVKQPEEVVRGEISCRYDIPARRRPVENAAVPLL